MRIREEDFTTEIIGGAYFMTRTGKEVERFTSSAAKEEAVEFCEDGALNRSASYDVTRYGDRAAAVFSRAWCHRMHFFFNYDQEARSQATYKDMEAAAQDFQESKELAEFAAAENLPSHVEQRIRQVRGLLPGAESGSGAAAAAASSEAASSGAAAASSGSAASSTPGSSRASSSSTSPPQGSGPGGTVSLVAKRHTFKMGQKGYFNQK